jgi:hypothetical protein
MPLPPPSHEAAATKTNFDRREAELSRCRVRRDTNNHREDQPGVNLGRMCRRQFRLNGIGTGSPEGFVSRAKVAGLGATLLITMAVWLLWPIHQPKSWTNADALMSDLIGVAKSNSG